MAKLTMVARWASIYLLVACSVERPMDLRAANPAIQSTSDGAADEENVIDSFKVDGNGGLLLIPVKIGKKTHDFVLDTGSNTTVFGPKLKDILKPTGRERVINGGAAFEIFECPAVSIGRSVWKAGQQAISCDLKNFQPFASGDIAGLIGMDFLSRCVIQVDFDAGRVLFLKRGTDGPGERIDLHIGDSNLPEVDVDLPGGHRERFLVDSASVGFNSGHLCESTFKRLIHGGHLTRFAALANIETFGGARPSREGALSWLFLTHARHEMQIFNEDNEPGSGNVLGLGYLARFKVTLDFQNRVMMLEKGRRFEWGYPVNWAGVDIVTVEGRPRFTNVDEHGPVWNAGIREGDILVSVAGRDASKLPLHEIGSTLQCLSRKPSTTSVHFNWGKTVLFKLAAPGRAVSVNVARPPKDELREFVLFRESWRSAK